MKRTYLLLVACFLTTFGCKSRQTRSLAQSCTGPQCEDGASGAEVSIRPIKVILDKDLQDVFAPIVAAQSEALGPTVRPPEYSKDRLGSDNQTVVALSLDDGGSAKESPEQRLNKLEAGEEAALKKLEELKAQHPNGSFKSVKCDVSGNIMKREVEDRGDKKAYKITWSRWGGITLEAVILFQSLSLDSARSRCEHELRTNWQLYSHIDRYVDKKIEIPSWDISFSEQRTHGFNLSEAQRKELLRNTYGPILVVPLFEINWTPLLNKEFWGRYNLEDTKRHCRGFKYWVPNVADLQMIQQSLAAHAGEYKAPENFTYVNVDISPEKKLDGRWWYYTYNWVTNSKWSRSEENALGVCIF